MKKLTLAITIMLMLSAMGFAQNETDALRYSQQMYGGTARFAAMGGSFGALGGDISSLSINPAGIAVYRSSEVTLTPSLNFSRIETTYFNTPEDDTKYDFNMGNFGAVITFPTSGSDDNRGWQFVNIGFGINRHNNFNERWIARGFNPDNALMTSFLEQAIREGSTGNLDDFSTGLAWDTWLLGKDEDTGFFVDMPNGMVDQHRETNSSGSIREFVLSLGANYSDRLYLGATFGFPSVRYKEENIFKEKDTEGLSDDFNELTYINSFETSGTGFNFKMGAIFRASDVVRIGAAFHTPTFYEFTDKYRASMRSDMNLDDYNDFARSPEGRFDYELETPMKAIGSLGLVFGTLGMINIDYEYTDYSTARLRSSNFLFTEENNIIRNTMTRQHTIRAGGEVRLDPVIFRAGYAFHSSPYKSDVNDGERNVVSAGFGIREGNYFIDFAYSYMFYNENYILYTIDEGGPVANRDFSNSMFRATLGWRF